MERDRVAVDHVGGVVPVEWLGIPGTWDYPFESGDWFLPTSSLTRHLDTRGWANLVRKAVHPYSWATMVAGLPTRGTTVWDLGGLALAYYIRPVFLNPGEADTYVKLTDRNLIALSHGLQPVLYACGDYNIKIHTLISVGSPVRKDMLAMAQKARKNIGFWVHIHSDFSDRMQWFGELFDGHFGVVRAHPLADKNVKIGKVGHSSILRDPERHHYLDPILAEIQGVAA